jgi:two-component system cell cycle sensor histidine kinase/response regulator CckA
MASTHKTAEENSVFHKTADRENNMRIHFLKYAVILLGTVLLTACIGIDLGQSAPVAQQGVIDLRGWNFEKDGPVGLEGEWEFYWNKRLDAGDLATGNTPEKPLYFSIPGFWKNRKLDGRTLPSQGFATFRLSVLVGDQKEPFAMALGEMSSAYQLWVNGELIKSVGIVGNSLDTETPATWTGVSSCFPAAKMLDVVLQISSYHHQRGGPWEVIQFGPVNDVRSMWETKGARTMVLFGSIFIIGLYHLGLFVLRRNEMPWLLFGVFCMTIATRSLITGEKYLLKLAPYISWELSYKIEYLTFYLAVPIFTMFVHSIFKHEFSKRVLWFYQAAGVIFSVVVVIFPAFIFTATLYAFQVLTIIGCGYVLFVLALAAKRKREGAVIFLLGFLMLFFTVINDILYADSIVRTAYITPFGLFCFIFFQSFLLSKRYAETFTTIENQSQALQDANTAYALEITERKKVQDELKAYHGRLQELVLERTQALTLSNQQLEQEIAEHRKSEKALYESKALFGAFMRHLPALTFMKDNAGRYIYINQAGLDLYGTTAEERIGRTDFELFPRDVAEELVANDRQVLSEMRALNGVEEIRIKDKTHYHLISKFPIVKEGEPAIVAGIAFDITDRIEAEAEKERLEAQLQRSQKMEALGLLAGGVAHDLNNVLSGIVSYPELLLMDIPEDSPLRNPILTIQRSGQKAAEIVQDLLTLARRGVTQTKILNLNEIVIEYLESPEHAKVTSFHSSIDVEYKLDEELFNIDCSAIHLKKTLMNLMTNAAEAQPKGGKICISTQNRYIDRPVKGYHEVVEGDYAVLSVADHGTGIAPEDLKHVFEPFYTKKVMGRSGTGLGMAVVWGTVKDHNGYIQVISSEGEGTRFDLYFPATREKLPARENLIAMAAYMGQGESILIIDDVLEQREIASKMLTKMGYRVDAVASGEEAVTFLKGNRVDLLVLDMIMDPGMDGLDTFEKIIARHPGQKAVIASGYSETDRVRQAQKLGAGTYIKKPYTLEKLGMAVRQELGT